ncbi:MAG: DNA polymerase III subunit epsilon, partial [Verrucomicrobiales bacterium]|nr:DNA polymerase III subunit epsilon [Verrucomicrobiales bacterium]
EHLSSPPVSPRPAVTLKTRYYLDHFEEMLEFVLSRYPHVIADDHRRFAESFQALNLDARCLYVRLVNRKGNVFLRDYLHYEEINDIPSAINDLRAADFVRTVQTSDYREVLRLHTRDAIAKQIRQHEFAPKVKLPRVSSARKSELIEFSLAELPFETICTSGTIDPFFAQGKIEELGYFLFLYFGRLQSSLNEFTLRDLGVMKTHGFKQEFKPRFNSREIAFSAYHYHKLLEELCETTTNRIEQFIVDAPQWPTNDDLEIATLRGRVLNKLGSWLERHNDPRALAIHQLSDQFPSTERTVRLLMKEGRSREASAFLSRLIENPSCDQELLFAEDFYERKFNKKKVGRLTSLLRESPVVLLDESQRNYPEGAVIRMLADQGIEAWHTENVIWSQLFGLTFWDLLFTDENVVIHNPFDRISKDLGTGQFYQNHKNAIESKLAEFAIPNSVVERLRETFASHHGSPNHLVSWSDDLFALTTRLVQLAPDGALSNVLRDLTQQWQARRNGFPDLMIIEKNQVRFSEIKAEGDSLRRNQLAQLERLKRAAFPVGVMRVEWIVDPEQDYVVVDVETTGGNAQWNRVTEIGAVRVRNGKMIEEWSSLINPQRRIPGNIVSLTGITDNMVAKAPVFADIAGEFRAFLDGAVFVAHRAKFDYGFIKTEYERIDQDFRCPTLCTVVESRRHFPGLPSYSLANLSAHFKIDLKSHHRALCDAKATAEILLHINEKRMTQQKK